MKPDLQAKLGFGLALFGLFVGCLAFVPGLSSPVPWPIFVGAFIYLPGSMLAFVATRKPEGRALWPFLRVIRMSFLLLIVGWVILMMNQARPVSPSTTPQSAGPASLPTTSR